MSLDDEQAGRWYHQPPFAPSAPDPSVTSSVLFEIPGVSCRHVLFSFKMHQIRRHRRLMSLWEIVEMVGGAVSLTTVLNDSVRSGSIKLIRNMVRLILEEMKVVQGINDSLQILLPKHPARF